MNKDILKILWKKSPKYVLVYAYIKAFSENNCLPSFNEIAKHCGVSSELVKRVVNFLVKIEAVEVLQEGNFPPIYILYEEA